MEHEFMNKSVAIIGGGASGSFCSYFLAKKGIDVTIFEKNDRVVPGVGNDDCYDTCCFCGE